MKKIILAIGIVLISASQLNGQATGTSKLLFDQVASSLTEANSLVYKYYPDNSTTGVTLVKTCIGNSSPFTCSAAFPAFTPGSHSLTMTASNTGGESAKSVEFKFTFTVSLTPPVNIRIGK